MNARRSDPSGVFVCAPQIEPSTYKGRGRSLLLRPIGISCMEGAETNLVTASISGHFHTSVAAT